MPTKITFYTPFPKIRKRELHDLLAKDTLTLSPQGLPLAYDSKAKAAGFEGYKKHDEDLDSFKKIHILKFRGMLAKKEKKPIVMGLDCPKNAGEQPFLDYNRQDILFVHSHGNVEVLGTGGFYLTPGALAKNLEVLGLSKTNPPIVVVWSCNSGIKDDEFNNTSYAERLRKELKELNYDRIGVVGIAAKIVIDSKNIADPISYIRKEAKFRGAPDKKIPEKHVMEINLSPEDKKKLEEEKIKNEGLLTPLIKVGEILNKPKEQSNLSPIKPRTLADEFTPPRSNAGDIKSEAESATAEKPEGSQEIVSSSTKTLDKKLETSTEVLRTPEKKPLPKQEKQTPGTIPQQAALKPILSTPIVNEVKIRADKSPQTSTSNPQQQQQKFKTPSSVSKAPPLLSLYERFKITTKVYTPNPRQGIKSTTQIPQSEPPKKGPKPPWK